MKVLPALFLFFFFATPVFAQETYGEKIAAAAEAMVGAEIYYDPSYVSLTYPFGDVPAAQGVCADVVIRAYRAVGVDFQKRIHEDMRRNFSVYPTRWGLSRPDRNIDHRRVLNIETFLTRQNANLPIAGDEADFKPGDIVAWTLPGNLPHMGVVSRQKTPQGAPLIVHHIGGRPRLEAVLRTWPMTGHYRYVVPARQRDR